MATDLEQAREWVDKLYMRLAKRRPAVEKFFKYFEGDQPLVYASPQWKEFHGSRYEGFSDNWCGVVARSAVDRMRIDGFRLSDSTERLTADEQQLWTDWNRNEMGSLSSQGFLTASVAKRAYTLVWGNDDDAPVVSWEHPDQVIIDHGPLGDRRRALKVWMDEDGQEYATLYTPEALWKFQRQGYAVASNIVNDREGNRTSSGLYLPRTYASAGGWEPRIVGDEPWPLPNPLGVVPVVEWQNLPMLGGYPISSISGTMAGQDAINLLWAYLFNAADYASMPARVVTGAEPPKVPVLDENGQVVGSRPAKLEDLAQGRLLFLPGKNGARNPNIGQWDPAKLDVFGNEVTRILGHIAAQTGTPGHYLLTNEKFANLNGDALTAAEVPLVTKVGRQELDFNPAAKETVALMALVRGKVTLARAIREAEGRRFVQWKNPAMHSESQIADAATKDRAVGMSMRTVFERRYGMTEPEIEQEMRRIREEQTDPILAEIFKGAGVGADAGA
ncbi:MAG TPA: phage portal protein [Nocardioidaceae bacterium]|nr:phage portal protein [Nocardioidaceae bacterium]